jgi:hypothetical protein
MSKNLKPGQRCTNSPGACGSEGHYYHKPFDNTRAERTAGGRCDYVQPKVPVATRAEVYAAIDTERAYQDDLWQGNKLTIGEFILLLSEYTDRAKHEWSTEKKPEQRALEFVRKVAGIAVNCMEQHGAPPRK